MTGPAWLRRLDGGEVDLDATAPVVVRACATAVTGGWSPGGVHQSGPVDVGRSLEVSRPGPVVLALKLVGSGQNTAC